MYGLSLTDYEFSFFILFPYLDRPKATQARTQEYILPLNGNVTLVCEVEANPQFHSVQWTKDGRSWLTTNTNEVTVINASPIHNGLYTCQAFNLLGGGDIVEIVVTVTEPLTFSKKPPPTVIVELGESVEIGCEGFGYPSPVQYWLRNNVIKYFIKVCKLFFSGSHLFNFPGAKKYHCS